VTPGGPKPLLVLGWERSQQLLGITPAREGALPAGSCPKLRLPNQTPGVISSRRGVLLFVSSGC